MLSLGWERTFPPVEVHSQYYFLFRGIPLKILLAKFNKTINTITIVHKSSIVFRVSR